MPFRARERKIAGMRRAVLMFDGPKRYSKHCEGCWGTVYRETTGPYAGLLCREDACIDNEIAVADETKRASIWAALEKGP